MGRSKRIIFAVLLIIFSSLFAAFAQEDNMVKVTVEKGDCLTRICNKYLENPSLWRKISEINKMKNPDLILPGQTILFPASMMKGTPVAGRVTFVKGDAYYRMSDKSEWKKVSLDDRIAEGAMVRTGSEGTLEIKFEDGNVFLLQPDTSIGLKAARKSGEAHSRYRLSVNMGRLITNVQKSTGKESSVQIESPTAILGVRGTVVRSYVAPDGTTHFEVLEGEVFVEGRKERIDVKKGEGTVIRPGQAPLAPKKLLEPAVLLTELENLYTGFPVKFRFSRVDGAVSCRIILARDKEMKDTVVDKIIIPGGEIEISGLEDGPYYMQNTSIDQLGLEGMPSMPVRVNIRVNPLPPFVEAPADGAGYKSGSLVCRWLNVKDAVSYRVQVSEDNLFTRPARDERIPGRNYYDTGNLDYRKYYFRVSSIASDGYQGEWSDVLSFSLVPPPPAPPVEPPLMEKKQVRIRWKNLGDGVKYRFQMSDDEGFGRVDVERILDLPELLVEKPGRPATYYVRTKGIDSEGREGAFSIPQTFVITPPPSAPVLGEAVVGEDEVDVKWQDLGPGVTYRFQLTGSDNFQSPDIDTALGAPGTVFKKPEKAGTYSFRVRAVDEDGRESPFSDPGTFKVKSNKLLILGIAGAAGLLILLGL